MSFKIVDMLCEQVKNRKTKTVTEPKIYNKMS